VHELHPVNSSVTTRHFHGFMRERTGAAEPPRLSVVSGFDTDTNDINSDFRDTRFSSRLSLRLRNNFCRRECISQPANNYRRGNLVKRASLVQVHSCFRSILWRNRWTSGKENVTYRAWAVAIMIAGSLNAASVYVLLAGERPGGMCQ
jgi:hypothetical protein